MISTTSRSTPDASVLAQMAACAFLWSTSFLVMKLVGTTLSPLALTAVRGLMGATLIGVWLALRGESLVPRGRDARDWIVLGILQGVVPNTLTAYALIEIGAGLSAMIQASTPLMVAVLAHALFADERLTGRRVLGVAIGFAGMALLLAPSTALGHGGLHGALAMVAAALSYALGNLYVRTIAAPRPLRLAFGQQALSGVPTAAGLFLLAGPSPFEPVVAQAGWLLALGVFGTALPIVLYMNILRLAGPTLGSMTGYLTPVWTVLLGALLLAEPVRPMEIAAGLLVLAGIVVVSTASRPGRP